MVASALRRVKVLSVPLDAFVARAVVIVEKSTPPDATVTPVRCEPSPKKAEAVIDDAPTILPVELKAPLTRTLLVNVFELVKVLDSEATTPVRCEPSPKKAPAVMLDVTSRPSALVFVMLDSAVKAEPTVDNALSRVNVLSVPLDALVARDAVTVERSIKPDGTAPLESFVLSDAVIVEKSTPPEATDVAVIPVSCEPLP